jgi:FdhE protein
VTPPAAVEELKRNRPEWTPWIAVVDEALSGASGDGWDAVVPTPVEPERGRPLLSRTTVVVDERAVGRLLERLIKVGARGGMPKMETLRTVLSDGLDVVALFAASIDQDHDGVAEVAAHAGVDTEALQAVTALLGLPFLHACNRQWRHQVASTWAEGYCAVCGSWPSFAEMRGIERTRYLRCGRCGGEWQAPILRCGFCRTNNHDCLATLVPEKTGAAGAIEACKRCYGYVKTFTRLQGCPPAAVMLEDLASVDLDVAAIEQGYRRPARLSQDVEVAVVSQAPRVLLWNTWNAWKA